MTNYIDVIGTDPFYTNWSPSPSTHGENIRDYIQNVWDGDIDNGSYGADVFYWSESSVSIPDAALDDEGDIIDRMESAEFYLQNNWSSYSSSAAVVVVDYWGGDPGSMGVARVGGAGYYDHKTALADTYKDANNNLPDYWSDQKSPGVAAHETGHLYNAVHPDGYINASNDGSLLMIPQEDNSCFGSGDPDGQVKAYSNCTESAVHNHIDNTSSIS